MKTLKKTLCLVLAVVMAVGVLVLPANAAEFTDDADITHDEAVSVLSGLSIVNGKGDGTFDPDGNFTRGQAAILLAQVVLTPEDAALLTDTKADFSDVPVTSNYNKYVTWAVQEGYIHGYPDGTFQPNKELTGLDLAALMLEVLGEELDSSNLKNFVALKTKEYGLSEGITAYSASKVISRDDAVQMMFNAMKYDPNGEIRYQVKDGNTDYGTYDTLSEAAIMMKLLGLTGQPTPVTVGNDNILNNLYNVTHNTANEDVFGRPTTTWTKDAGKKTEEDLYLSENDPVAGPYYTEKSPKDIFLTDLKLDETKSVDVRLYIDGVKMRPAAQTTPDTRDHASYSPTELASATNLNVGGTGYETTVYKNGDVYDIFVVTTKTHPVTKDEAKAGVVELIAKNGTTAAKTYEDSTLAEGDIVIWQGTASEVFKAQKAEIKNGRITGKSTSTDHYFLVEGGKTYLSAAYKPATSAFAAFTNIVVNKDNVYNVWTDFQGNAIQIALDTGDITVTAPNYVYVLQVAANAGTSGSLTGDTPAYARARLYNLSTGEITDEDIAIAQKNGTWYYANKSGNPVESKVVGTNDPEATAFATYELTDDGKYVLNPIDDDSAVEATYVTISAKQAKVEYGESSADQTAYANASSKVVLINCANSDFDDAADFSKPVEIIGYSKFVAASTTNGKVLVLLTSSGAVDTIYVIADNLVGEPEPETKDYALFMSKGDTDLNGTPYTFYIDGKTEVYYSDSAELAVEEGGVYMLTFEADDATRVDSVSSTLTDADHTDDNKITTVSDGYILVDGSDDPVYLTDDCVFYNKTAHTISETLPASVANTTDVTATIYAVNKASAANDNFAFIIVYTVTPVTAG